MMVYPLTKTEERVVVWCGRCMTVAAVLAIALLGALALVA